MGSKAKKKGSQKKTALQKPSKPLTRKERRKAERQGKKVQKQNFYLRRFGRPELPLPRKKDEAIVDEVITSDEEEVKPVVEIKEKKKDEDALQKLQKSQKAQRKRQLLAANKEEEATLKHLEKQLKMNRNKGKDKTKLPKSFTEDGLDFILDACDSSKLDQLESSSGDSDNSDQEDSDNANVSDMEQEQNYDSAMEQEQNEDSDIEQEQNDDHDSDSDNQEEDIKDSDGVDEQIEVDEEKSDEEEEQIEKEEKTWEDIYGRTRDKEGNVVVQTGKYVPPAMRSSSSNALARLEKQIKGHINRLAESNLSIIARSIESLYNSSQYSRNDMNECMYKILSNSLLAQPSLTPERLVMEHAVLVAVLSANVGVEIGANILQKTIMEYKSVQEEEEGKRLDNCLHFVSQLYAFRVVGHDLIFDLLDQLAESMSDKNIDLVVLVLRSVGFMLRKDDAGRLKTFILSVQSKCSSMQSDAGSRVHFMLETLLAIRNNNVRKLPNYDPTHQAHLQKIIKSFLRPGASVTPLNVRLTDLLTADTRGRWWIVGSAWTGKSDLEPRESAENEPKQSDKLLKLARGMRMNTDARRSIFCAIMSSEDYTEAFEKVVKLPLKSPQKEKDTAFVLLACCLKEPTFNPFYPHIVSKLAKFERKYRMAAQCGLWDKLSLLSEGQDVESVANLAQYTCWLIKDKTLSLACLKKIEFADLNKSLVKYVKAVLLGLLEDKSDDPFVAVAGYPKLAMLRQGLTLFMRHFVLKKHEDKRDRILCAEKSLMIGQKQVVL